MGAWATGINMGVALQRNGIVKNTGPDLGKILSTLRFFGPGYRYLITGFPPFLKHLIELNADFREAWKEYPDALVPRIELYRRGEGPFANDSGKIKQVRMLR